MTGFILVTN